MENSAKELVTKAWVLLDQNHVSQLYILFNEDPDMDLPAGTCPKAGMFAHVFPNHIVAYGNIDETGKYWSSRAGVINRMFNMEIIDVVLVLRKYHGIGQAIAVTKVFAEEVLKEFNLPFHFVINEDSPTDKRWDLVQNDTYQLIGKRVTAYDTRRKTTEKVRILDTELSRYAVEHFVVDTREGTRYYGFDELRDQYAGMFWEEFRKELKEMGISDWP